jgi:hypothetical protein
MGGLSGVSVMVETLAPCPFCGKSEHLFTEPSETGSGGQWIDPIYAGCSVNGCGISVAADTEAAASTAWNTRHRTAADERVKALEGALRLCGVALNDWVLTYASDMCDEKEVAEAWIRIRKSGAILLYISDVEEAARRALGEG